MSKTKSNSKALSGKYKPFDPRVKFASKSDEAAARVQWSSKSLSLARKAIDEGLPIKFDPFFKGNSLLKKEKLLFRKTKVEQDEFIKCKYDILHFAETYCQLLTETGDYNNIKLRTYQKKLLVTMAKHDKVITLGSRQLGKTTTTAIFILWLTIFHKNVSVACLGDKIATAVENLNKIKEILYRLPEFLKPGIISWNVRSIVFDNRSKIFTGPCTKGAIVGKTCTVLFIDELAIPNPKQSKELVDFAFPVVETQDDGKIFVTSTPNGDNVFKDIWLGSLYGKNDFVGIKVPWYMVPGRDLAWRDKKIKSIGIDAFNEQWNCQFLSSNECMFNDLTLKEIASGVNTYNKLDLDNTNISSMLHRVSRRSASTLTEPIEKMFIKKDYDIDNFKKFPHVIVVDIAEGIQKDYTVFNVFRPKYKEVDLEEPLDFTEDADMAFAMDSDSSALSFSNNASENVDFEQVAIFHSNEHCIRTSALFLRIMLNELFNQDTSRVVIELNKYGGQFLDLLLTKSTYPQWEIEIETIGFKQIGDSKLTQGIMHTKATKPIDVRQSKTDIESGRILLTHSLSIDECKTFGQLPNGSYAASNGAHDDIYMTNVILSSWATPENLSYDTWVEEYIVSGDSELDNGKFDEFDYDDIDLKDF